MLPVVYLFLTYVSFAEAFDGGDAAALVAGVLITVMITCACLGCIAKRKSIIQRQQQQSQQFL